MRKFKMLLLLLFLHLGKAYAQVEIRGVTTIETDRLKSDPFNTSPNKDFEKRINLNPIDESTNDLEIRLYKLGGLSNTRELKTVVLKNGLWTGTLYDESNHPRIRIKKYKLEADKGFPALFQMLLDNKILELPSQEELAPKMKKFTVVNGKQHEQRIHTTDGQSYTVEFKIGDAYRVYTYHNPETYSSFYSDVQELKDFVVIKNIFENELKQK